MNVTIIYGSDAIAAYSRFEHILQTIKKRGWEIANISKDGKSLAEKLRSTSLFETQKLFVLDKPSILTEKDLVWIKKNAASFEGNFLIYSDGKLPIKLKNAFGKNVKVEKFDLPMIIFQYLDNLYPKNSRKALELLHENIKSQATEMIIAMMATHLRDLYWVKSDIKSYKSPSWRTSKLKSQSDKFTEEQLKSFVNELAELDTKSKTSQINLAQGLDLLLVSHLQ